MAARCAGISTFPVLLLVLLLGAGGWNYHTNTQLDNAVPRPFRNYSDGDLQQLIGQYQGERNVHSKRFQNTGNSRARVQDRGLLGDQVNEFERVQQISRQRRDMANQVSDRQISLDQLQQEQGKREADRPIYKMIFRRLFTI